MRLLGKFSSVSAGSRHTCGVKVDGSVVCWGSDIYGQATPPSGEFSSISTGSSHTCGVKTDGSAVCWGGDDYYGIGQATPPSGEFSSVSAGFGHTCGVKVDGSAVCWGNNDNGQSTAPSGEFSSVSAGDGQHSHTCGVRTDGSVACWGNDSYGQSTAPSGEFSSVSAENGYTCGVNVDGSLACWGLWGLYSWRTPPSGEFSSVSIGGSHTCWMKVDGSVTCWGNGDYGQATPPSGEFSSVSAGGSHTCGVRTDGSVACWGNDSYGQSTGLVAPNNVRVVQEGSSLRLTWDPVPGATHYAVYDAASRDPLDVNVVGAAYTHTNPSPGEVRAVRVVDRTSNTLTVNWRNEAPNERNYLVTACNEFGCLSLDVAKPAISEYLPQYYMIHRQPEGGTAQEIRYPLDSGDWDDSPQYVDEGLQPSTVYYYWVQVCGSDVCSGVSDKTGGLTESDGPVDVPSAPTLQAKKNVSSFAPDSATVTWDSVEGATYYELWYGSTPSSTFTLAFEVSAPIEAQSYRTPNNSGFLGSYSVTSWKVKACNKSGCSPFSEPVTIR